MVQVIYISYVLFIIFLSLIPMPMGGGVPYLDKVEHAVAYCVMGILAYVSVYTLRGRIILYLFMFLLGVAIEFLQLYIPGRESSLYDELANTAGLALAFLLCRAFSILFKRHAVGGGNVPGF
jgi:VanZ family protein